MKVTITQEAYNCVIAETLENILTETGGVFLGYIKKGHCHIVKTLDPGPKATFTPVTFQYDNVYLTHLANKINRMYSPKLQLVGLWHRHPGNFDRFSSVDDGTNLKFANLSPHGAVSGLITLEPNLKFTLYHVSNPLKYHKVNVVISNYSDEFEYEEETLENLEAKIKEHKKNMYGFFDLNKTLKTIVERKTNHFDFVALDDERLMKVLELLEEDMSFLNNLNCIIDLTRDDYRIVLNCKFSTNQIITLNFYMIEDIIYLEYEKKSVKYKSFLIGEKYKKLVR